MWKRVYHKMRCIDTSPALTVIRVFSWDETGAQWG